MPSNHNMQSNHNLQKQPAKRASKTYEMATQIISKGNKPQRESIGKAAASVASGTWSWDHIQLNTQKMQN